MFERTQKMKVLHKGICKDVVLVTLICEEVGQSGICNELRKLLIEFGFVHESIVRPFARPDFRPTWKVEVTIRGLPKDSLGVPLRGTPPEDIHFPKNNFLKKFGSQK